MVEFFKNFIAESKRVIWPNKKDLVRFTVDVIVMSVLVSVIIFFIDIVFSEGMSLLQQIIK
jgi:preprotein translocase subunit SecE